MQTQPHNNVDDTLAQIFLNHYEVHTLFISAIANRSQSVVSDETARKDHLEALRLKSAFETIKRTLDPRGLRPLHMGVAILVGVVLALATYILALESIKAVVSDAHPVAVAITAALMGVFIVIGVLIRADLSAKVIALVIMSEGLIVLVTLLHHESTPGLIPYIEGLALVLTSVIVIWGASKLEPLATSMARIRAQKARQGANSSRKLSLLDHEVAETSSNQFLSLVQTEATSLRASDASIEMTAVLARARDMLDTQTPTFKISQPLNLDTSNPVTQAKLPQKEE
jgi:predicted subunit of tRNA(5-methylaminomethyl-2-thiouridylate) methyltransferase